MAKTVRGRAAVRTGVRGMLLAGTALAAIAMAGQAAGQDLTGQQVTWTNYYPDLSSPNSPRTTTVGDGLEFNNPTDRGYDVDVVGDQIVVTYLEGAAWNAADFNGFVLDFAGGPNILAASLDAGLSTGGATPSFDANSVFVNWAGQREDAGDVLVFNLTLACATSGGDDACQISRATDQSIGIDAQGGADTLRLSGDSGAFSFDAGKLGTTYLNFEELRKTGASDVTLTGAFGQTVWVDEGELSVAGSVHTSVGDAVVATADGVTIDVKAGGSVTADGMDDASVSFVGATGTLLNAGTITGDAGVYFGGAGTVTNAAGGLIEATDMHAVNIAGGYGEVTNAGTIRTQGEPMFRWVAVALNGGGTVTNEASGVIEAYGGSDAIYISGTGGVTNAGAIRGDHDGVFISWTGTVDNQAGGEIQGGSHGVAIGGATTVTNAGTISATSGEAIYANGLADITNSGGVSSTYSTGVHMQSGGQLTNSGTITGDYKGVYVASGAGAVDNLADGQISAVVGVWSDTHLEIDNAGTITGSNGNAIYVTAGGAQITNSGALSGGGNYTGVYVAAGGGSLDNKAGGTITGGYDGVWFGGVASVENAGSISTANPSNAAVSLASGGTVDNYAGGTLEGQFRAVYLAGPGTVTNDGTISATVDNAVTFGSSGTLINHAGGEISAGRTTGGWGVFASSALTVDNAGSIEGEAGVVFWNGGSLTNRAGGVIDGRIYGVRGNDGVEVVETAGAISGGTRSVFLGGGDDTLRLMSGATLTGAADGGDGTDALVLGGTGADTIDVGQLLNFESGTKTGTGTWTLTGVASNALGWDVQAGVLRAGGSAIRSNAQVSIAEGARFELTDNFGISTFGGLGEVNLDGHVLALGIGDGDYAFDGAIVGSGELYKWGAGDLILNGTSAASGILIDAGVLRLGGDERIADTAQVDVNVGAVFDLDGWDETVGVLTGQGEIALGGGNLSLGYGGQDFGFFGDLTGTGSVTKIGTGFLVLGNDQAFTGQFNVDAGALVLAAQIASDMVVRGGSLTGSGQIGGALRVSGGTVAPGGTDLGGFFANSLTVTGGTMSFGFAGADRDYASDFVGVTGAVTLSGGVLDARPVSAIGQYGFNQSYLLIDGASLSGQFSNLTSFTQNAYLPGLYQRLRYDLVPGGVVLEVRRMVDWSADAETDNQRAVAGGIEGAQMGGGDDWSEVLNLLLDGTPDERRGAYDAMSGEGLANVSSSVVQFSQRFQDVLQGRMGAGGGEHAGGGTSFAALPFGQGGRTDVLGGVLNAAETGAAGASGAWAEAFVLDSQLDGQAGVADTTTGGGGFAAGFDVDAGDGWRFGFASGYSDMRSDTDARATSAEGQFWHVGAYAGWDAGPWWAGAAVSRLTGDVDTDRKIGLGPVTLAAAGRTDVDSANFTAAFGRRFALGETTALDASASVNGTRLKQDGYSETGAGALSLDVAGVKRTVWVSELDARVTRSMAGGELKPYAGAGAAFAGGDLDALASVAFSGAPGGAGAFVVDGAELPSAWATLEAGVAFKPSERVWVSLAYDGALAQRLQEHRGGVKVSLKW